MYAFFRKWAWVWAMMQSSHHCLCQMISLVHQMNSFDLLNSLRDEVLKRALMMLWALYRTSCLLFWEIATLNQRFVVTPLRSPTSTTLQPVETKQCPYVYTEINVLIKRDRRDALSVVNSEYSLFGDRVRE